MAKVQPPRATSTTLPSTSSPLARLSQASSVVPAKPSLTVAAVPSSASTRSAVMAPVLPSDGVKPASITLTAPASLAGSLTASAVWKTSPLRVAAPTASVQGAAAGEPMVPGAGPSLPAAATTSTPASVAASSARSSGSVMPSSLPSE